MAKKKKGRSPIEIKPSHEGRFSAFAQGRDESVQQAASYVLSHEDDFSDSRVKQANFARNARKWHH